MFEAPLTNESFPLKHVLGWEGGGGGGGSQGAWFNLDFSP